MSFRSLWSDTRLSAIPPLQRRHGGIRGCNECRAPICKAKPEVAERLRQFEHGLPREA